MSKLSMLKLLSSLIKANKLFSTDYTSAVGVRALVIMNTTVSPVTIETKHSLKRELNDTEINEDVTAEKQACKEERIKKRKIAMLLSYCGQGYLGLQRNQGTKTIEEELLVALRNCRLINEDAYTRPQAIQFQRAARTDKGVSALRQALSMKLPESVDLVDINKELPEQIRVMAIRRVTKGFNSKGNCDARTYSYTLPTFAFAPHEMPISEDYRVPADVVQKVNDVLKMFEGTHNFHNFTSKVLAQDPSAYRYMIKLLCESPFIIDGMEFAVIKVKGQSFMLHQIRKMVGLVIAIVRGLTSSDVVKKAYELQKLDIPVAPGLGLLLEEVHYDRYNLRYGRDGIHQPLEWSDCEDKIEAFRQKFIIPVVLNVEKTEKSMISWLETLHLHTFDVRKRHLHEEQNDDVTERESLSDAEEDNITDINVVASEDKQQRVNSTKQDNSTQQVKQDMNSTQVTSTNSTHL